VFPAASINELFETWLLFPMTPHDLGSYIYLAFPLDSLYNLILSSFHRENARRKFIRHCCKQDPDPPNNSPNYNGQMPNLHLAEKIFSLDMMGFEKDDPMEVANIGGYGSVAL
jgi:hypothetical protein